jgi:hypothetical protein
MDDQPDVRLPNAEQFRDWIVDVLCVLKVKAHRLGEVSGIGPNSARKFVTGEQYDVRLNTAHMLVAGAQKLAEEAGTELPPIPSGIAVDA